MSTTSDGSTMSAVTDFPDAITATAETRIVGKRRQIEYLLVAFLCQGHVLLTDGPGSGKTMLALA